MKKNALSTVLLVLMFTLPCVQLFAQEVKSANHSATHAMTDAQSIEHVMKALFEKPDAPLKVSPISIEGDYAVAGWIQDQRGGRALLKREKNKWSIQVCGGDGLTQANTLAMTGMSSASAKRLAAKISTAEKNIPTEQVKKFALFEGMVKVDGGKHDPHASHGSNAHSK